AGDAAPLGAEQALAAGVAAGVPGATRAPGAVRGGRQLSASPRLLGGAGASRGAPRLWLPLAGGQEQQQGAPERARATQPTISILVSVHGLEGAAWWQRSQECHATLPDRFTFLLRGAEMPLPFETSGGSARSDRTWPHVVAEFAGPNGRTSPAARSSRVGGSAGALVEGALVLGAKGAKRARQDGGGAIHQPAASAPRQQAREAVEGLEILRTALVALDASQDAGHLVGAHLAGRTLAAGALGEEGDVVGGLAHDARALADDDHRARAETEAASAEAVEVEGDVEIPGREQSVGGAAGEHRLELPAREHPSAMTEDELAQGRAEGQLVQTWTDHVAGQGVELRPRSGAPEPAEPGGSTPEHVAGERQGLDVVHEGRLAAHPRLRGPGRFGAREGEAACDAGDRAGLFSAHVLARARSDRERHLSADGVAHLSKQGAVGPLERGPLEDLQSVRDPRVDVEHHLAAASGHGGDQSALDDLAGCASEEIAILARAGLVLVGVAEPALAPRWRARDRRPFLMGRDACASHAAQLGGLQLLEDRRGLRERGAQARPSSHGEPVVEFGDLEAFVREDLHGCLLWRSSCAATSKFACGENTIGARTSRGSPAPISARSHAARWASPAERGRAVAPRAA